MSADPGTEVRRALALLEATGFIMGTRDKAYDKLVKDALAHLQNARAGLGVGPAPEAAAAGLEPSIVEWIFGAADAALATSEALPADAVGPTKSDVLSGALLSIREWAARLLQKPAQAPPGGSISTPRGLR